MIKSTLKKYFRYLHFFYVPLRWRIAVTVILSLLVGCLDGLGLAMFVPMLGMTEPNGDLAAPSDMGALGYFVEFLAWLGVRPTLVNFLLVMLSLFCLKGLVQFADAYYRILLRARFTTAMRTACTRGLAELSYERFVTTNGGQIQNTLSTEVVRTVGAFVQYFATLQMSLLMFVYICLALSANPQFTALVLVGIGISSLGYRMLFGKTRGLSKQLSKKGHWYHALLIQSVHLFKYLKATGQADAFSSRLLAGIKDMESTQKRMGVLHAIAVGIREPLAVLMIVIVILVEVVFFGGSISTVVLSVMFFYRALGSLTAMQTSNSGFLQASGAIDTIREFQESLVRGRERSGKRPYAGLVDAIELRDVTFAYQPDRPVLDGISLRIRRNETIAIVGESGSGKTTLVNVIAGLLRPSGGSVRLDGVDLQELRLREYRSTIGYITQEPVVFADTVYNNVTFWAPKTAENLLRFWQACETAAIRPCVESLAKGEETSVGDNGVLLSGGQRQRLSIARELYRQPEILILDEATSALDSETENIVQENIELLRGQCTMIVVAHRLSTVKAADRIFALEDGRLLGEGSFSGLMQASESFSRMVELQSFVA